jgi:tetratricopeptide (TPR) repeat protein
MEMSPTPERALWAGDRLVDLVPDGGHLVHMATHIDVLCGQYHDVVARNRAAAAADARWLAAKGPGWFYTLYCCHNLHFRVYGAMFLGQYGEAMAAAEEMKRLLAEPVLRPMANWFESFWGMDLHVMVRFGRWRELTRRAPPADRALYAMTTALTHYARGVAHSALGEIAAAEAERTAFAAAAEAVPATRMLFNNSCRDILKVAEAMLAGELAYRKGAHDEAFAELRRAVALDDGLPYDEPWGWMQPTRHALGALLLEQGRVAEAEAVYRADLGLDGALARPCQHPDNMWSLHGLHECLTRRGADAEARLIAQRLAIAAARAEEPPRASCACRMGRAA